MNDAVVVQVVAVAGVDDKNLSEWYVSLYARGWNFVEGRVLGFDPVHHVQIGGLQ